MLQPLACRPACPALLNACLDLPVLLVDEKEAAEMAAAEQHLLKALGWKGEGLIALAGGGDDVHGDGDGGASSGDGSSSRGG